MNSTANDTTAPSELCDPNYIWPPASERAHDSLRPNIYASTVICWLIAALFVGLRLYTRSVIIRVLGPTDWSILTALVFSLATSVGTIEREYLYLQTQTCSWIADGNTKTAQRLSTVPAFMSGTLTVQIQQPGLLGTGYVPPLL